MGIAEAATAGGVLEYMPTEIYPGIVVNMQTLYMSWLTMAIVAIIVFAATRNIQEVPSGVQNLVEMFVEWLNGLMDTNIGVAGRRIAAPFVITLFLYLFIGNEIGMLPQIGIHISSPTNDVNVPLALALMVSVTVYIYGVSQKGFAYFKHLVEPFAVMLPLNILEEVAKPVTMALRLFGNILAGEILLEVLYKLVPFLVPNVWIGFSLIIGFLQAFIFTMLTVIAIAPAFSSEHK